MAQFSPGQTRAVQAIAAAIGLVAVVLLMLRVTGRTALPPFIPMLLLVAVVGIVVSTSRGR